MSLSEIDNNINNGKLHPDDNPLKGGKVPLPNPDKKKLQQKEQALYVVVESTRVFHQTITIAKNNSKWLDKSKSYLLIDSVA